MPTTFDGRAAARGARTGRVSTDQPPTLSVIVPAFNEEARLPDTLWRIRQFCDGRGHAYQVLVVDDGSRDRTWSLAKKVEASWPEMQVISLPENQGKGAAVMVGMLAARGARRLFTDADLSTPIGEVVKLEAELDRGAGIAVGSRSVFDSMVARHQPPYREFMGRIYNCLLRRLVLPELRDTQCGFKLFTAEAAAVCFAQLECLRFGFDAEVLVRARAAGIRVAEVGVVWRHANGTRVRPFADSGAMLVDLWLLHQRLRAAAQHGCSRSIPWESTRVGTTAGGATTVAPANAAAHCRATGAHD